MDFSSKTNRVFQVILAAFFLIALRVWHLEVVQREDKLQQANRPRRRTVVVKADRGEISDRFHIPLAVNKICYNATLYYNQILQIPSTAWREDPQTRKRVRVTPRKDYIRDLSRELAAILSLDHEEIEDLIHAKASLLPHAPFVLKSFLSEEEHYRLAALEKDWPGVHAEICSTRVYPRGKIGCEILGSMGSISNQEYLAIAHEIEELREAIENWESGKSGQLPQGVASIEGAVQRLAELTEKAYTVQDLVGRGGVEGYYEEELRGYCGKKMYEIDRKGNVLSELPGTRAAIPGSRITLSISAELQEFAEALLAQDEEAREGRSTGYDSAARAQKTLKQPWIKGGSIVAMDPNTGEILAMASTPRFDPNDFIPAARSDLSAERRKRTHRWLETDVLIASIWDGLEPLMRERYRKKVGFSEEKKELSWDLYLQWILPTEGPLKAFFAKVDEVRTAVQLQEDFETLQFHSGIRSPHAFLEMLYPLGKWAEGLKMKGPEAAQALRRFDAYFGPLGNLGDRLFALDLCRLVVYAPAFSDECLRALGSLKLADYRAYNQEFCRAEAKLREERRRTFHQNEFAAWRHKHQKEFLHDLRQQEKKQKKAPRPFTDALRDKEEELFAELWATERLSRVAAALPQGLLVACKGMDQETVLSFLHTFRSYKDLERPLLSEYPLLRKRKGGQTEKELAAAFYPRDGFGFCRSHSFQATSAQGSIFKLVTSYAALHRSGGANPLTLIDETKTQPPSVATSLSGTPYPRMYKGGRLPKSHLPLLGRIDLPGALEQSSNPYFSILAGDVLSDPEDLIRAARLFGYGSRTGIDLPMEASGHLPDDLHKNKTGLYATAIGQHTLLATPLQAAVMLSAIANGGELLRPIVAREIAGLSPDRHFHSIFRRDGIAREELQQLGIDFSLFTAAAPSGAVRSAESSLHQVTRSIEISPAARNLLIEGMDRAVWSSKGTARPGVIRKLITRPELLPEFLSLRHQMVGKTSTVEVRYNPNVNPSSRAEMYKHIWFGAISFEPGRQYEKPELVVVVFLRYGDGGKEAAPLAAQMVTKWRQILSQHEGLGSAQ